MDDRGQEHTPGAGDTQGQTGPALGVSHQDKRLVGALSLLRNQLDPIIEEILAGQLDQAERRELATVFATLAGSLDPERLSNALDNRRRRVEVRGMGDSGAR